MGDEAPLGESALDALPSQDGEFESQQKPVPKGLQPLFLTMRHSRLRRTALELL